MIGFDCGTYNLVCCRRDEKGNFENKWQVNAFLEIPLKDDFLFNMMNTCKDPVPLIKVDDMAYAIGEKAVKMAYTMSQLELKRPMKDGCVNPKERDAFQILNTIIHSLLDNVSEDREVLYYSVPANAINEETDAEYHGKLLEAIFKAFKSDEGFIVDPRPINEALALIYAELGEKNFTGIGVSCLIPGTKIYTKRGIINIEDVKEGDLVLTHKGRYRKVDKVITKQFEGVKTRILVKDNKYEFVDNHELYVNRNEEWNWIGCEEIKEGDIVGEPVQKESDFETDMFVCSRVQKIENEDYQGTVYDLKVEEDHSFSGPYMTIHNCGAGMVNVCFAIFGAPVFQFSLVNSGDWIDKMSAKATGESTTFINKENTKVDLVGEPKSLVERAIQTQYRIMIENTVQGIKKGLEANNKKARMDQPVDVIVAGGTASAKGFDVLFAKVLKEANLPMEIGEVIRPEDPLFSVARGCLIAAEHSRR